MDSDSAYNGPYHHQSSLFGYQSVQLAPRGLASGNLVDGTAAAVTTAAAVVIRQQLLLLQKHLTLTRWPRAAAVHD